MKERLGFLVERPLEPPDALTLYIILVALWSIVVIPSLHKLRPLLRRPRFLLEFRGAEVSVRRGSLCRRVVVVFFRVLAALVSVAHRVHRRCSPEVPALGLIEDDRLRALESIESILLSALILFGLVALAEGHVASTRRQGSEAVVGLGCRRDAEVRLVRMPTGLHEGWLCLHLPVHAARLILLNLRRGRVRLLKVRKRLKESSGKRRIGLDSLEHV